MTQASQPVCLHSLIALLASILVYVYIYAGHFTYCKHYKVQFFVRLCSGLFDHRYCMRRRQFRWLSLSI